jgi:signal peptidase I
VIILKIVFQIYINYLAFWVFPRWVYFSLFANKRHKLQKELKDLISTTKHQIKSNRDFYGESEYLSLKNLYKECQSKKKSQPALNELEKFIKQASGQLNELTGSIYVKSSIVRELTDTLVISFAIAFGIRSLFFQPFKIPTGSMQPTLYGIHLEKGDNKTTPNPVRQLFNYVNYSWRYPASPAVATGTLVNAHNRIYPLITNMESSKSIPFFPNTKLSLVLQTPEGTHKQPITIPAQYPGRISSEFQLFNKTEIGRFLMFLAKQNGKTYQKDENILNARLVTGDHLFVNRFTFQFREPKRGDITVFVTDGFENMAGRYYIKRLIGMPGDTITVKADHKLWVKEKGKSEFRVIDGNDAKAFEHMYSMVGGYRGYSQEGCFNPKQSNYTFEDGKATYHQQKFVAKNNTFTIPDGYYFMMGDNSYSSRDSRYFGPVPRKNLVGTAMFTWWPFSRRWGLADQAEPDTGISHKDHFKDFENQ